MRDEEGLELAANLFALGMTRYEVPVTVYLSGVEVATPNEIRIGTGMRQPEVSNGIRTLSSLGWIEKQKIKCKKKGYALKVTLADIVTYLETKKMHEADQVRITMQKLKRLALSLYT
jgi:predicted transcriptional regulator